MASVIIGDYEYITTGTTTVRVKVVDTTKVSYGEILSNVTIDGVEYSIDSMTDCFQGCSSLTTAPEIPSSVDSMAGCFGNCTSLTTAPVISSSVMYMSDCFRGCTSLTGDVYIMANIEPTTTYIADCFYNTTQPITLRGANTDILQSLASTANNNNVYVNIAPTLLPNTIECSPMNYMTNDGLVQLSLQTDASLVTCEVPHNNSTVTTTLQDALLDLYSRTSYIKPTLTSEITNNGLTFTPTSDGGIYVNGTSTSVVKVNLFELRNPTGGRYYLSGVSAVMPSRIEINIFNLFIEWRGTQDNYPIQVPMNYGVMRDIHNNEYFNAPYLSLHDDKSYRLSKIQIQTYIPSNRTFSNVLVYPKLRLVGDA